MLLKLALALTVHFIADFLLQTDWQARNKWNRSLPLLSHTAIYSICFLPFGWKVAAITFLCHTLTDFCTSKVTHGLSAAALKTGKWHNFFAMIGFDQWLHHMQLIITLAMVSQ